MANPGISQMLHLAAALATHGELAAYYSPAVFSEDALRALEHRLPRPLAGPVVEQLSLRAAPPVLGDRIVRVATPTEITFVMANRIGLTMNLYSQLVRWRDGVFDRAVSGLMQSGLDAVIGYHSTSVRTFEKAGECDIARVLDFPMAHHEFTEALLREELKRVPAYAATMIGHEFEPWRKHRYVRAIDMADRIIMNSTFQRRTFEAAGIDPERMFMAHFGVDLDLFSPGPPRDGVFRVLFCGLISQAKGISYLVEGFKRAELAHAELVFTGRPCGSPQPWINEPSVRHVPPLPRPRLVDVYRSADVIVLPSLTEGFPLTPLEGMACGLPAIVSEHTSAHDLIDDGVEGWVTPIRDADAIAAHLRTLYEDRDLRRRMGQAARRKAEQFTWSRYAGAVRAGIAPLLRPDRRRS